MLKSYTFVYTATSVAEQNAAITEQAELTVVTIKA